MLSHVCDILFVKVAEGQIPGIMTLESDLNCSLRHEGDS
jgi:hypothetical protein